MRILPCIQAAGTVAMSVSLSLGASGAIHMPERAEPTGTNHQSSTQTTPSEESPTEEILVRVAAVAEHPGITPGGTVWVGIRFDIKEGWHTYWPGQNDTGFGTQIEPSGPQTLTFGAVRWPAPHRHTAPGDILDHVHNGSVLALIPVTASPGVEVGSDLDLSFDLAWLVCDSVCIPGWETVTLTLPVVDEMPAPDPASAGVFAAARARIPEPVPQGERVVTIDWVKQPGSGGKAVRIRARGAFRMAFYPDPDCTRVRALLSDGTAESDQLLLRFEEQEATLSGVVEVFSRDGLSRVYRVRSEAGGA